MQVFDTKCSVMSDYLFPKNNIVLPTNGRAPQLCWGKTIYSLGNFALYDRNIIFFYFFLAVAGWRRFYYKYFYFFLWRCVTHRWGRVWGVNLFQTKWFIFYFYFFYGGGHPSLGEGGWVKLNAPVGGLFFFCFFFFCWRRRGGGGKNLGGSGGKSEGEKEAAQADNV